MGKRSLQVVTALLAVVPVLTGIIGLFGTSDPLYALSGSARVNVLLDTNLRFFAGTWLGLGLALFWIIPRIDRETILFRVVWGMIFVGGIGRLTSMYFVGLPPAPFVAFTLLEVVGAPFFVVWQARVTR